MTVNSWQPTFPVQLSLVVNQVQTFQHIQSTSYIPSYQSIPHPDQAQVNVNQPLQATSLTKSILPVSGAYQAPLTQCLQGILQSLLLG